MKKVIIIGGGKVGRKLASLLINEDYEVIIIEKNEKVAEELSKELNATIIYGDGTSERVLLESGIKEAESVIVTTSSDEVNLLASLKAKKLGVKRVIARVSKPENYSCFRDYGIEAVDVTTNIVLSMHELARLSSGNILLSLANGKGYIVKVIINENSKVVGRRIGDLEYGKNIIWIERNEELLPINEETFLMPHDVVIAYVNSEELKNILDKLS
jgi:trk system potassium uptake protein TrkA